MEKSQSEQANELLERNQQVIEAMKNLIRRIVDGQDNPKDRITARSADGPEEKPEPFPKLFLNQENIF